MRTLILSTFLSWGIVAVPGAEPLTEFAAIRALSGPQLGQGLAVAVEGRIEFLVPTRKLLFLKSGDTWVAVVHPDLPNRMKRGQKVRVKGITIADKLAQVRARQIQLVTGPVVISEYRTVSIEGFLADPPLHEVVEIRGIVHRRLNRGTRIVVGLRDGSHSVEVQLCGVNVRNEPERFYFSTARVRAAVIPSPPNQSSKFQLVAHGWDCVTMEQPEPSDPFQTQIRTVAEILKTPPNRLLVERARIRGRIIEISSDGSAVLDDGTGRVVIVPRYSLNVGAGDVAEVIGFTEVSPDSQTIRLEQTRTRKLRLPLKFAQDSARKDDWPSYLSEMGNLRNVRFMGRDVLANNPPVRVRGNVVRVASNTGSFVLQDKTTGIEVFTQDRDVTVDMGAYVEVAGHATSGRAAVAITNANVRRLSDQKVAQPIVPSPEGLAGGRYEAMWIALEGVGRKIVFANGETRLEFARGDRRFTARFPIVEHDSVDGFIDARLRVEGIARAIANDQGEVRGSEIMVGSVTNIVVKDPATSTETIRSQPIADLRRIRPGGGFARRYRTQGTVMLTWPGLIYIADQDEYLRVRTVAQHGAKTGQLLDVIGFPFLNPPELELNDAIVRPLEGGVAVTPRKLKAGEKLTDGRRGELVELQARLVKLVADSPETVLIARLGSETFSAVVPQQMVGERFDRLIEGSLLGLRGILTIEEASGGYSRAARLLLPDAEAVTVLELPPWWTTERLLSALGVMAMVIALVLLRSFRLTQKVLESESRLTSAALASPVAVTIISAEDGHIIEANDRLLSEFNFKRSEMRGRTFDGLGIWGEDNLLNRLRRIAGNKDAHLHTHWATRGGEKRSMVVSADEIEFDSQLCLVVSGVDVTEKTELLEQLRDSQKMEAVGQLAAGIAHDFNNLLTIINGNAEILETELKPDSPLREFNDDISRAGTRAAELTRHLLAFSRKQVLREVDLELGDVVHSAVRMLKRLLPETIDLKFEKPAGTHFVKADRGMVEQVLVNLAVNARDAMAVGGTLTLQVDETEIDAEQAEGLPDAEPGAYVRLTVTDTGSGMDEPTQHRIFEPFFTTKDVGKGTGLGLATVYGIVRQHHGWISVRSQRGEGTSFFVHLPMKHDADDKTNDSTRTTELQRGTEKVLLVEDEEDVRRVSNKVLSRAGYDVVEAEDGLIALEKWAEHKGEFDVLVSDVFMPNNLSGVDLARKLITQKTDLRILLISGYSGENVNLEKLEQFGVTFLDKPVTQERLLSSVRELLDSELARH